MKKTLWILAAPVLAMMASACSSAPPVKTEAYAQLRNHRTFEYEMPVVWHAIEDVFRNTHVTDRDPKEVSELEMRSLKERTLKTDWAYSQSRDKYEEYKVNDTPRKVYLQERNRYRVGAKRVMGGTDVTVQTDEEIERINSDGSSAGYHSVDKADSSRADEILNKINQAILAAPPTNAAP